LGRALEFAEPLYAGQLLSTGEPAWAHALGLAGNLAAIGVDAPARAAGVLFAAPKVLQETEKLREAFGDEIAALASGVEKLYRLRLATRGTPSEQNEILRKMVLGMAEDVRVVLIRLASRTQTLRWFSKNSTEDRISYARETLDIYAPLANRLGVWQLKWELEDLSFRYLEPEVYQRIARMLDEKRLEREHYIARAMAQLKTELEEVGLTANLTGRPKHIYSIWNKMRAKQVDFSEVYDVRALRVIVPEVKDCYTALGVVHNLWQPIPREFDDYISRPKGNLYQSLHTAVLGPGGKTLEVQIRTEEMHRQAEYGVAAHWQYKEKAKASKAFEQKVAWLRQLLAWRDEVPIKKPQVDDVIYVLTPQARVIDLPVGATPIDFAYTLHSDLGHRCRGARVDGRIVKLDTPLASGQRVEIVAAKSGGPSRDWLNPERGFVRSARARHKIRQWFNAQALEKTIAAGRAAVEKELRREGATHASLEGLAAKLGFAKPDEMFAAVARDEVNLRQLQVALKGTEVQVQEPELRKAKRPLSAGSSMLVVGMEGLATQLARCCKPVPPDAIRGFVTRGKGVSIHREDCSSLKRLTERHPERVMETAWGRSDASYAVDMTVTATDRRGLLRDIGDALARERINVTAVRTQTREELAFMRFTFDVGDVAQLKRALALVRGLKGVIRVARG
ncbi:MAG TPA: bifunctional (p)ppGpp synthetase/guanosine-3',5'-bis(diphosphate) 3'-pyrophosphohydrolase, partial [Burkholderiales bacterium]|nr:bifunctional (p)ppGpp synthetase/guanosine-3',5'-bis(diphosphate) 3'-pyrophosphohydrolase [Burkholderiales bacterium]